MVDKEIDENRHKEELKSIYLNGSRKARRSVLKELKSDWKRQQKIAARKALNKA